MNNRPRQQKIAKQKANPWINIGNCKKIQLKTYLRALKNANKLLKIGKVKFIGEANHPVDITYRKGEIVDVSFTAQSIESENVDKLAEQMKNIYN